MASIRKVSVKAGLENSFVVDGVDIQGQLEFVSFQHQPGQTLPTFTLGVTGALEFDGEAVVQVVGEGTSSQSVSEFLGSLDIPKLEAKILERDELDEPNGFLRATIAELQERVNGGD